MGAAIAVDSCGQRLRRRRSTSSRGELPGHGGPELTYNTDWSGPFAAKASPLRPSRRVLRSGGGVAAGAQGASSKPTSRSINRAPTRPRSPSSGCPAVRTTPSPRSPSRSRSHPARAWRDRERIDPALLPRARRGRCAQARGQHRLRDRHEPHLQRSGRQDSPAPSARACPPSPPI